VDRCKSDDFDVFLATWNVTQNYKTPFTHFQTAIWLQKCWERGETRLLLQAFRASGKSTLVGLFTAWLLCRDPDLRILVLSAEASLAEKMVRTVRKVIERHPLTAAIRPNNPDQWASDSFTIKRHRVSRDPSVLGRGLYANNTGTRADVIICDDVEVPNTCDTAEKRIKLRERLSENEFILTPEGRQLYIGTPHSYYSIYADTPRKEIGEDDIFLKGFCRRTVPIVDGEGRSAWPEKYPPEKIAEMRIVSGPAKFNAQMMLVPVNILDSRLDPKLLRQYDEALHAQEVQQQLVLSIGGKRLVSCSAWWDPAFGSAKNDASVLAVVYTDAEGKCYLHRVEYITVKAGPNEDEASLQCKRVAQIADELFIPTIAVETNGIGKFLPAILRREINTMRVGTAVLEHASRKSKADRILSGFDARMAARSLYVHADVYKTRFITEMQEWNPSVLHGHDDGLDAAAGAISMEPVRIKRIYGGGSRLWIAAGSGHTAKTDFDV
jgi:hypothetical protein